MVKVKIILLTGFQLTSKQFDLTGWKTVEINGIEFKLNFIFVEKREEKPCRLVKQRQRRIEGGLDIFFWGRLSENLLGY